MATALLNYILYLALILPFIFFSRKKSEHFKHYLFMFILFFFLNQMMLNLPRYYKQFHFIDGSWNWSGKMLATAASLLFVLLYRKLSYKDVGLTLRQKGSLKVPVILAFVFILVPALLGFFLIPAQELNAETLAFQLTMPAIDEEIAFRGIMLALLNKAVCHSKVFKGVSTANLVTSLLFGFMHALSVSADFSVSFEPLYFAQTFLFGIGLAYIIEKTDSLFIPLLTHSLGNFVAYLIAMVK